MSGEYTYEIVSVDEKARCMEVVYRAAQREALHVGVRLPYVGETLESVIAAFAPTAYWEEQARPCVAPEIGAKGALMQTDSDLPLPVLPGPMLSVDEIQA